MAEGTTVNTGRIVCPFYLYSSCQDGARCKYTHDDTATCSNLKNVACRFFLKGICKYGDNCWFLHSTVKGDINSKPKSRNDKLAAGPSRQRSENHSPSTPKHDVNKVDTFPAKCNLRSFSSMRKDKTSPCSPDSPNWVNAPEFVPKTNKSYADTLKSNVCVIRSKPQKLDMELCMHFFEGKCPYNDECPCIHGNLCELCRKYCLNPYDERQRKLHIEYCEKELEQDMELSFAIQRSVDKTCGICMDVIMEKDPVAERRFGILEKCNHVFCLSCIRKWRRVKTFESAQHVDHLVDPGVTRACPECRVSSDFITPSQYWVDTEDEKKKLIADYKVALSKKPCKYFKQGKGTCPFGGACFYLHAKPDGTKVDLPLPTRRRRQNQDGELDFMGRIILWDYLEVRDQSVLMHLDLDELVYAMSDDTDHESESSEEDFFISESF
ncbi:probable E3 ubiquitin-protein ligase makorin-1 [Parasteatoda tepidariorum]|uniref:probable E3 ubiquitin-protein ligase makorin-1 n=1 Tax=Parasteatoda tepidariorum TaxID=114398 RepID=UPI00077FCC96|nr:probable E3 ubiquitin-protein ligase makorin-1 [Parasteatoda tepidariorum]